MGAGRENLGPGVDSIYLHSSLAISLLNLACSFSDGEPPWGRAPSAALLLVLGKDACAAVVAQCLGRLYLCT